MQLLLELDDGTRTLAEIHRRLRRRFGAMAARDRLDPVSQLVLSVLGGRTRGAVSVAAYEELVRRFGTWESLRDAPTREIYAVIRAVTFAEVKAPRLKAALESITRTEGGLHLDRLENIPAREALARLESLPGVGIKTGAATLNFSTLHKPVLVIDSHHLRVLRRLEIVGERSDLRQAYDRVTPLLPPHWTATDIEEHHWLIKKLGQTACRYGPPTCRDCPLSDLCPTAGPETPKPTLPLKDGCTLSSP